MTDLQKLLSSVSEEDLSRIKDVAQTLISGEAEPKQEKQESKELVPGFSVDTLTPVMTAISKMTDDDDRIRLILHLKPLLSDERKRRADDAVKFLHIMQILPELRGLL